MEAYNAKGVRSYLSFGFEAPMALPAKGTSCVQGRWKFARPTRVGAASRPAGGVTRYGKRLPRDFAGLHLRESTKCGNTCSTFKTAAPPLEPVDLECRDIQHARAEAIRAAGETLRDFSPDFWSHRHWTMWVEDDCGSTVLTLNVSADLHGLDP